MSSYSALALLIGGVALISMGLLKFRPRLAGLAWWLLSLLWSLLLFVYLHEAGVYSLSGIAATCGIGGLVLSICQAITYPLDSLSQSSRPLWSAYLVLFLALCALIPETVHHDTFMKSYFFAVLFFISRPICVGCTAFAIAGVVDCLYRENDNRIAHISKDMALLSATVFLGGEIAGSLWSFVGWGTTWRWSGNFYLSAMLFVAYIVALHIPRTLFTSQKTFLVAFVLPLALVFLYLVLSKL